MKAAAVEVAAASGAGRLGLTRGALAAIGTMVAIGIAVSLLPPLLSLNLSARGVSERIIGLLVAANALASLFVTPFASGIAARFGTARVIVAATLFAAALFPAMWAFQSLAVLFPLVFVYGAAMTLCFTLSEFWINAAAPAHRRGFVIGLYATVLSIGFALGPAVVSLFGYASPLPFLAGAAIMTMGALPAFLARKISPDFGDAPRRPFAGFIFAVPVATAGVFVFAGAEQSSFTFLPLWGRELGLAAETAVLLTSAMVLGQVALQIPIGLLADRVDRRVVLLGCGLVGAIGIFVAHAVSASVPAMMIVLLVWGGASAGIYTVGLSHLASRFSGGDLASANAAFIFCYALGMLIGPAAVGDAMTRAPVLGLPVALGAAFGLYSLVVAVRILRGPPDTAPK
jgi:MFS family permease